MNLHCTTRSLLWVGYWNKLSINVVKHLRLSAAFWLSINGYCWCFCFGQFHSVLNVGLSINRNYISCVILYSNVLLYCIFDERSLKLCMH